MNKSLIFKILYYVSFILTTIIWLYISRLIDKYDLDIKTFSNTLLGIINLVLIIIFSIKLLKYKLEKVNILFPIIYLIFSIIVMIISFIMNNKLVIPYIHFNYYVSFVLFNYFLLNAYSVLSLEKIKKVGKF